MIILKMFGSDYADKHKVNKLYMKDNLAKRIYKNYFNLKEVQVNIEE